MSLRTAADVQAYVDLHLRQAFPKPGALTIRRGEYATPPTRIVRVVATAETWRLDGGTVEVGRTYSVPADVAESLAFTGKARLA